MKLATLTFYDVAGSEVARYELVGSEERKAEPQIAVPLPATLDWHRDLAKWVAAAAAAVVSLGLSYSGDTTDTLARISFSLAAVFLLIALCSAFALHTWVIELAKLWEQRGQIPSSKDHALQANRLARTKFSTRSLIAYWLMIISFCIGIALFAFACGVRMLRSVPKTTYALTYGPHDQLVLTEVGTGETWQAVRTKKGVVWSPAVQKRVP